VLGSPWQGPTSQFDPVSPRITPRPSLCALQRRALRPTSWRFAEDYTSAFVVRPRRCERGMSSSGHVSPRITPRPSLCGLSAGSRNGCNARFRRGLHLGLRCADAATGGNLLAFGAFRRGLHLGLRCAWPASWQRGHGQRFRRGLHLGLRCASSTPSTARRRASGFAEDYTSAFVTYGAGHARWSLKDDRLRYEDS
jgi:hypothetical protein